MRNPRYSGLADLQPVIAGATDDNLGSDIIQPDFVVPAQWSAAFRRRHQSREAALLAEVLVSAWQDLDSPKRAVRLDATVFFEMADAGEPLSLRFLCEAFELELSAVQQIARARIQRAQSQGRDSTSTEDQPQPFFGRARVAVVAAVPTFWCDHRPSLSSVSPGLRSGRALRNNHDGNYFRRTGNW